MRRLLLGLATLPVLAQSGEEILARVDRLRHPWPEFSVALTVKDARSSQRWRVSARANGDARLEGLSEKEQGRAVLMLGDQMWLLVPGSRRPVKVTPQQRMMGPAAGGDVARTRFRIDYEVAEVAEESLEDRPCWRLELTAKRPSASARAVRLWVARDRTAPLLAEYRLASGKLARTVRFGPITQALGQPVLSRLEIQEAGGGVVELSFSDWERGGVPPGRFELPEGGR